MNTNMTAACSAMYQKQTIKESVKAETGKISYCTEGNTVLLF
jgi:hypothetical protein